MAAGITIDRVTKAFGSGAGRAVAVDDLSLTVEPGELFFLLGPSGCGKTTLLRIIAGFLEPDSGRILFGSRDVTAVKANRRNTGMVFQSYALWPHMTVEANVAFGLTLRQMPRAERARRVAEALEAVHMLEYAQRRPNQLSGGQQQRIALARALVVRPDVLLLDEPLSNLDARLRAELRAEVRRICKNFGGPGGSITTIYVTHDQKEALSMADRIAILDRGRVVQVGTPADLYHRPTTAFVAEFLGDANLVEGQVIERSPGNAVVETPIGRLVAALAPADGAPASGSAPKIGTRVTCLIRPEAVRISALAMDGGTTPPRMNRFAARITETTFLGELMHYRVEVASRHLSVLGVNPSTLSDSHSGGAVTVEVAAADIILIM